MTRMGRSRRGNQPCTHLHGVTGISVALMCNDENAPRLLGSRTASVILF